MRKSPITYPKSTSGETIENRFDWSQAQIDKPERFLAQQYARFAQSCTGDRRDAMMNRANAHLAGAMQAGGNDAFWAEVV